MFDKSILKLDDPLIHRIIGLFFCLISLIPYHSQTLYAAFRLFKCHDRSMANSNLDEVNLDEAEWYDPDLLEGQSKLDHLFFQKVHILPFDLVLIFTNNLRCHTIHIALNFSLFECIKQCNMVIRMD